MESWPRVGHMQLVTTIRGHLAAPTSGSVTAVEGRTLKGRGKPLASRLDLQPNGGSSAPRKITIPTNRRSPWTHQSVIGIGRRDFDRCPICLSTGPLTDEHVPPERLGGSILTTTCARCNNRYGELEDSLMKISEVRFTAQVTSPGFEGSRRVENLTVRHDEMGNPHYSTWNGSWPGWFDRVVASGQFVMDIYQPCRCRAYASLLKSAFLAACIVAPDSVEHPESWPLANLVRRQLMLWRDSRQDHLELLTALPVLNHDYGASFPDGPEVAITSARHHTTGETRQFVKMGWRLLMDWPIDRITVRMIDGTLAVEKGSIPSQARSSRSPHTRTAETSGEWQAQSRYDGPVRHPRGKGSYPHVRAVHFSRSHRDLPAHPHSRRLRPGSTDSAMASRNRSRGPQLGLIAARLAIGRDRRSR